MTTCVRGATAIRPVPHAAGRTLTSPRRRRTRSFACHECGEVFDPARADALTPCVLVGTDGNAFAVIGTVARCLKRAGKRDRAKAWVEDATSSKSYDELMTKLHHYVDAH